MRSLFLWISSIGTILLLIILSIYFLAGGKTYLKVLTKIYKTENKGQNHIKTDFFSTEKTDFNSGILAGSIGDRVWFWGKSGLVSYKSDKDTAYFFRDWCSKEAQIVVKNNGALDIRAFSSLKEWNKVSKAGQYLVIKIATNENGGMSGNLREIRAYNYLPFLEGDINTLCKK